MCAKMVDFEIPVSLKLVSLYLLLSLLNHTTKSAHTYASHSFSNSRFFTPNNTYQDNLNLLLSALSFQLHKPRWFLIVCLDPLKKD